MPTAGATNLFTPRSKNGRAELAGGTVGQSAALRAPTPSHWMKRNEPQGLISEMTVSGNPKIAAHSQSDRQPFSVTVVFGCR